MVRRGVCGLRAWWKFSHEHQTRRTRPADVIFSRACFAPVVPSACQQGQALLELLAQVPDPRDPRCVRRSIGAVLGIAVAAAVAGAPSFTAIGEWAADCPAAVLAQLGVIGRVPDEATIRRLFSRLDADADALDQGTWM